MQDWSLLIKSEKGLPVRLGGWRRNLSFLFIVFLNSLADVRQVIMCITFPLQVVKFIIVMTIMAKRSDIFWPFCHLKSGALWLKIQ